MTKPRKPESKVEESAVAYGSPAATDKNKPSEIRFASAHEIEASNQQLMRAHRETLRKLAK